MSLARPYSGVVPLAGGVDEGVRGHIVEFYASDDELIADVVAHLAAALASGGAAIAIATEAHRIAFVAGLAQVVVEPHALDRLRILDADETLQQILLDGEPAADRFEEVIGGLIESSEQPVHAYGEMVAILWDAGRIQEAIDLESMWNGLGERYSFVLLCGYPVESCLWDEQAHELSRVCELHGQVTGSAAPRPPARPEGSEEMPEPERVLYLSRESASVRAARSFIQEALADSFAAEREIAEVVVSELVTNALEHGSGEIALQVVVRDRSMLISVGDDSSSEPTRRKVDPSSPRGRGLQIIEALASGWGVTLSLNSPRG